MTTPPPVDPLIGQTVSQYEIVAKLGGGGMGVVYKARDIKLGRAVALKFLPPQWSHDDSAKQRFVREAQAASATNHRNICVIHNIEETVDGRLFIVMAYYEGETLKQRLERGPLPIAEVVEIGSEIAEGLAKAHAQGVVHRDVKPGNLIVTDDGVKILDFGLAKFADALQLTVPGSTIGTVAYMAPEQARGEEADIRSDVWALGIVMFEMLTGSVPFHGSYPEATFHAIKNEPLPSLTTLRPDTPESIERIVMKALEKDPAQRFQTAREPARDLRQLAGRTVPLDLRTEQLPRLASLSRDAIVGKPWLRRVLTARRLAFAAALVVAVIAGAYFWISRPIARLPIAVMPVINQTGFAELEPYRLALTQTFILQLRDSTRVRVLSYNELLGLLRRFLDAGGDGSSREAVQAVATQSGAGLIVIPTLIYENRAWRARAELRDVATATNVAVIETDPAASSIPKNTSYEQIAALVLRVDEHFASTGPQRARWTDSLRGWVGARRSASARHFRTLDAATAFAQGVNAYEQLEYVTAKQAFEQTVKQDPLAALGHAWLSRVSLILQSEDAARTSGDEAVRLLSAQTPPRDIAFTNAVSAESRRDDSIAEKNYRLLVTQAADEASSWIELAAFQDRRTRNGDAVTSYRKALEVNPRLTSPHVELCRLYGRMNEPSSAKQEGELALAAYRAAGNRHGEALALMCLTNVLRLGDAASQRQARENAEAAARLLRDLQHPYNLARAEYYIALVAEREGPAVAEPLYAKSLGSARASGNVVLEPLVLMNLGAMNVYLGRQTRALEFHQQSHDLYERFGDERRAAQLQSNIASILIEYAGRPDEGLRDVENAREIFRKLGDKDFEAFAAKITAKSYRYAGRLGEAERELNRAVALWRERDLLDRIPPLDIDLSRIRFDRGDYEGARSLLAQALKDGDEKDAPLALVSLGRVQTRMGDFAAAASSLDAASRGADSSGTAWLQPSIHLAKGELAEESGRLRDAKAEFERAAALWIDELPESASVEARAHVGLLDAVGGATATGRRAVETSLKQAEKMRAYWLIAQCRLYLARIALLEHRDADALSILSGIAPDGEIAVGPELQAQAHFWRAATHRLDPDTSQLEQSEARKLVEGMAAAVPIDWRAKFLARPEIARISGGPVR